MIKMVKVDEVPTKAPPVTEVLEEFIASPLTAIKLDLSEEDQPRARKQQIYNGIYNAIKNRNLDVKITMVEGEIYLQKITPTAE
jgi:hypothetical protein